MLSLLCSALRSLIVQGCDAARYGTVYTPNDATTTTHMSHTANISFHPLVFFRSIEAKIPAFGDCLPLNKPARQPADPPAFQCVAPGATGVRSRSGRSLLRVSFSFRERLRIAIGRTRNRQSKKRSVEKRVSEKCIRRGGGSGRQAGGLVERRE